MLQILMMGRTLLALSDKLNLNILKVKNMIFVTLLITGRARGQLGSWNNWNQERTGQLQGSLSCFWQASPGWGSAMTAPSGRAPNVTPSTASEKLQLYVSVLEFHNLVRAVTVTAWVRCPSLDKSVTASRVKYYDWFKVSHSCID